MESSELPGPLPPQVSNLSIMFTNDAEIQTLNLTYRGKDKPTDVLSFLQIRDGVVDPGQDSIGDVVISLDTASKQADEMEVSLQQEVFRLLIHGILHLFGFQHENVSDAEVARMQRMEELLFQRYLGEYVDFQ